MNHCLDEGIVDSAIEADMALIWALVSHRLGVGFVAGWMSKGLTLFAKKPTAIAI